jgi:hypothetical protein
MGEIVPFGKYRGRALEEMLADRDYCDWLLAQGWFGQRYQNIYNVIVGAGNEPADTPQHNKLQALFLDAAFCRAFLAEALGSELQDGCEVTSNFEVGDVQMDVVLTITEAGRYGRYCEFYVEIKPSLGDDFPTVLRQIRQKINSVFRRQLRHGGEPPWENCGVLYEEFSATSVSLEQVKRIFHPIKLIEA